jgi:hypothetical protein
VIRRLAGLASLPPIPIVFLALVSNSVVTIVVFGPPKSVQQRRAGGARALRWLVQAVFFALGLAQLASDVRKVGRLFRAADAPAWARLNAALALWVCSANTTKAFALQAMHSLHGGAISWAQRHGVPGAEQLRVFDTIGALASWLYNVLAVCYMLPAFVALAWSLPALGAYCYVLVPLYGVLIFSAWLVLTPLVRAAVRALHRRGVAPVALEASQPLSAEARAAALAAIESPKSFAYEDQHECFLQTGAPLSAWSTSSRCHCSARCLPSPSRATRGSSPAGAATGRRWARRLRSGRGSRAGCGCSSRAPPRTSCSTWSGCCSESVT